MVSAPLQAPLIQAFDGFVPQIGDGVFLAPNATVVGNVSLAEGANVWYGAVLRGDVGAISIGARSTIQDLVCLHTKKGGPPVVIGQDVHIGHGCIVHGATIERGAYLGNGVLVLDGAIIGERAVVSAGALVARGAIVPPGTLVRGRPARVIRNLSAEELETGLSATQFQLELARKARGLSDPEPAR